MNRFPMIAGAVMASCLFVSAVRADDDPIVSEIRTGVMRHDAGIISSRKEMGEDINGEVLFRSPSLLDIIWSPRPHLGVTYNLWGQTSQVYGGITWQAKFTKRLFGELSFGPSLNDGHLNKSQLDWKDLGSPVLFRESLSLGWRFTPHQSLSAFLDHISNAGLAKYNGGMETLGLRYGYKF